MGPDEAGLSSDWVFSLNSSHVCNDKRWFKTLEPFPTAVVQKSFLTKPAETKAEGVGTVDLPVKRSPHLSGRYAHHVLRLENVIYVPDYKFNVVGMEILRKNDWVYEGSSPFKDQDAAILDQQGLQVCYMRQNHGMSCIRLSGPPHGPVTSPTQFDGESIHIVGHIMWPETERVRFERHKAALASRKQGTEPSIFTVSELLAHNRPGRRGYTTEEKAWLKKYHGNEYKFLQSHGLSIYKEDQREEGRAIARNMMQMDEKRNEELATVQPKHVEEPTQEQEKKKNRRGGKKKKSNANSETITAGVSGDATHASSVDIWSGANAEPHLDAVETGIVDQSNEHAQTGKRRKNKKKSKAKITDLATDTGSVINNTGTANVTRDVNPSSNVGGSQIQELEQTAGVTQPSKKKRNNKKKNRSTNEEINADVGGSATRSSASNLFNDAKTSNNSTGPETETIEPTTKTIPTGKKKRKNKGTKKANIVPLSPEQQEQQAQTYLHSLIQNVAAKHEQDRQRAEATPPPPQVPATIPQPSKKKRGNMKRNKNIDSNHTMSSIEARPAREPLYFIPPVWPADIFKTVP
ncbi:hypothetical protein PFICI_00436 [Pestalotiopsis fici W106-1]|uniref:Retrovirus-related Pol polyprotein from transposon TNT 1-94-like beta-barrel domain-containing protein n=1 Tax=Pestalotiopsis fici (strain W106-1 / CGMCC3.15140) TaxID=1229662 RepID=W3XKM1_PESFW|nr:uncharacterized protein PFICI_00436 [Pestalotiopsis fici W106-1]ETS86608.1 hypothetical protein PFICI_00436 [Pestalotiopsis fici W106-1]